MKAPATVTISASPTSVPAGTASILTVTATSATTVSISGSDGSTYTMVGSGGTQSVTPSVTTTYTVTATGTGGTATAAAKVTVLGLTVTMTANPTSILSGSSSTLTVTAVSAASVSISGSDGTTYTLPASGGTQTVTPTLTTTYTATATGATGTTATATAIVTVTFPPPTVSLIASPTSVVIGNPTTLTAVATNATSVIITGTDGSSYTLAATGGTKAVSPTATTTYTATATGGPGTTAATATAKVTVTGPPPTATFSANPTSIVAGNSSTLTVTYTNANSIVITGGATPISLPVTTTSGSVTTSVSPTATTTYTATVTGPGGTVTPTATVTVTPAPPPTITITPATSSIHDGASAPLTITATNATSVTLSAPTDSNVYTVPSVTGGVVNVTPTVTAIYTGTATGLGGTKTATATVTVIQNPPPTVTIAANKTSINLGGTITLTVTATNATAVAITASANDTHTYPAMAVTGGTQVVTPTSAGTLTYTATATGQAGTTPATATTPTITVGAAGTVQDIQHVVFMLQENHSFDNYFGMLNPYRKSTTDPTTGNHMNIGDDGNTYNIDGIDDRLTPPSGPANPNAISNVSDSPQSITYPLFKFTTTCIEDNSSDWLASFGDVYRWSTAVNRPINMDGFVHDAEGYALSCYNANSCSGGMAGFYPTQYGQSAMGYYDQHYLNFYYFMASEFALSDRWFSPVASKSVDNRIATFSGGTTQGLVKDPTSPSEDNLPQLAIPTIFRELTAANVPWRIYYTATQGDCPDEQPCAGSNPQKYFPATDFLDFQDSFQYIQQNTSAPATTYCTSLGLTPSSVVNANDTTNSFCIDTNHIAPIQQFQSDASSGNLPSFAFIEAGYGFSDEHPGAGQSILTGQFAVYTLLNQFMTTPSWANSAFFFAYDEGGGPYDHVPPVPNHSNDKTISDLGYLGVTNGTVPDIGSISINPDAAPNPYFPCVSATDPIATTHCDLSAGEAGANSGDVVQVDGFGAQIGFRVPNFVVSPFAKRHYVSHIPMDHTAVIKFVENRFIGPTAHLTLRDQAQPDLLDFFDFNNIPWSTPPTPPYPVTQQTGSPGHGSCHPGTL